MPQSLPELPVQPAGPGSFPHRTPQDLRAWCADLPGSDPELRMQRIREALEGLNAIALRPGTRVTLLEILEEPLLPSARRLETALRQQPLPLGVHSRERARLYATTLRALLNGHLLVVRERLEGTDSRHAKRASPELQAAVGLLAALGVHYWRLYQPLPNGHWRELFGLLRLARDQGLASDPPGSGQRYGPLELDAIEMMVARLMVLGSTDPNALRTGEIDLLARWVNRVPLQCRETPRSGEHPEIPVLRADLDRDHAPGLVLRSTSGEEDVCFVELLPALEALRESPESLEPGSQNEGQRLAEHLLRLWSHLPTRRHSRESTRDQQRVCVLGLEHIHDFLVAEMERNRHRGSDSVPEGDADKGPQPVPERDRGVSVFQMSRAALRGSDLALMETPVQTSNHRSDLQPLTDTAPGLAATGWEDIGSGLETSGSSEPAGPITKRHPPERWQVDDMGAGGVRLSLEAPQQSLLIGDLVGLRPVDSPRWSVGVLRWIRYSDRDGANTSLGVEFLAERCLPMQIQNFRNGMAAGLPQVGLFAPQRTDARGAVLFLPAQVFDHEKRVVCWLNERARVMELDSERTGTALFTEVGCRMTTLEVHDPARDSTSSHDTLTPADDDARSPVSGNRDDELP